MAKLIPTLPGLFSIFFLLQKAKPLVAARGFCFTTYNAYKKPSVITGGFCYLFKFLVLTTNSHEKAAIQISPTIFALRIWSVR